MNASHAERRHVASPRSVLLLLLPLASSSRLVSSRRSGATRRSRRLYATRKKTFRVAPLIQVHSLFPLFHFCLIRAGGKPLSSRAKVLVSFSLFLCLMRLIKKIRGEVAFAGQEDAGLMAFQAARDFRKATFRENVAFRVKRVKGG